MELGEDLTLWKRIAMQRRALKELEYQVAVYEKLWRKTLKHGD